MFAAKVKLGAVVLAVVLAVGGAGVWAQQVLTERPEPELPAAPAQRVKVGEEKPPARVDLHGDPLPEWAVARLGTIRWRHANLIAALTFAPDGKSIYSSCLNGRLSRWDTATGERLQDYQHSASPMTRLAVSPDGKHLVVRGNSHLHETVTARAVAEIPGGFRSVAFSRDGRKLALAQSNGTVLIREVPSLRDLYRLVGHKREVSALQFSPKEELLATADEEGTIILWDTTNGKEVSRWEAHFTKIWQVSFSPNGQQLASVAKGEHIRLWDVKTWRYLEEFVRPLHQTDGKVDSWMELPLHFSPDGRSLFWLNRMWDIASNKEIRQFGSSLGYGPLALSPDGTVLAHAAGNRIRRWRVADGQELDPDAPQVFDNLALSPDGKFAATVVGYSANVLRLYDTASGTILRRVSPPMGTEYAQCTPVFSPDGRTLATGCTDNSILLLDPSTGQETGRLRGHKESVRYLAFSPDGRLLASESWDETARLWDLTRGKELRQFPIQTGSMRQTTAFSHDGRLLATRSGESSVAIWEATTGKHLRQLESSPVWSVSFSPDARWLVIGNGEGITFWNPQTWKEEFPFGPPPQNLESNYAERLKFPTTETHGYTISPDSRTLAVVRHVFGTTYNKMIHLYELAIGKERLRLREHRGDINTLQFSADSQTLASASRDTTALLWDLTGRRRVATRPTEHERALAWEALAGADAERAYQAIWTLAATPAETLALLRPRLTAVPAADLRRIEQLISDLNSVDFTERERASAALAKLRLQAQTALEHVLTGQPSLETRRRVEALLEPLRGPLTDPEELWQVRAVEVLEHLGTPDARALLKMLAAGAPAARQTREALAAARRLAERQQAP